MSPIGRAFIIINFLLSAVFLSYGAFYLQSAERYKEKYDTEKTAHEQTKKSTTEKITSLQSALDTAGDDRDRIQGNLQDVETRLADAKNENSDLKKKLDTLNTSFTAQAASFATMSTTLDNLSTRNKEITQGWIAAQNQRDNAIAERNDMQNQLTTAQGQYRNASESITALTSELNGKADALRKMNVLWEAALAKVPDLKPILLGTLPAVDGTVVAVNTDLKTVTLSIGTNQADVKKGWTFSIHDGTNYKGEVQVIDVDDNVAIARYRELKNAIVKGDKASTRL